MRITERPLFNCKPIKIAQKNNYKKFCSPISNKCKRIIQNRKTTQIP